jgi:hypothetical protein
MSSGYDAKDHGRERIKPLPSLASEDSRPRTPPLPAERVVRPIAGAPAHDPRDQNRDADIDRLTAS